MNGKKKWLGFLTAVVLPGAAIYLVRQVLLAEIVWLWGVYTLVFTMASVLFTWTLAEWS